MKPIALVLLSAFLLLASTAIAQQRFWQVERAAVYEIWKRKFK